MMMMIDQDEVVVVLDVIDEVEDVVVMMMEAKKPVQVKMWLCLIFLQQNRNVRIWIYSPMAENFLLATAQKVASSSSKTQKIDSKPAQGTSATNQPRISSAIQVTWLPIYWVDI